MKKIFALLIAMCLLFSVFPAAHAEETDQISDTPQDITEDSFYLKTGDILLPHWYNPMERATGSSITVVSEPEWYCSEILYNHYYIDTAVTPLPGVRKNGPFYVTNFSYFNLSSGEIGYCIQPFEDAATGTFTPVEWEEFHPLTQRGIGLALIYGSPNNGDRTESGYVATHAAVRDMAMCYRNANGQLGAYMDYKTGDYITSSPFGNKLQDEYPEAYAKYCQIIADIQNHGKVPSFTSFNKNSAPTYELQKGADGNYSITLTDTNGVLERHFHFTSSIPGLTFTKSGNSLTIKATPAAAAQLANGITINSNMAYDYASPETAVTVWQKNADSQKIAVLDSATDPTPAYFNLTAEVSGALKITKSTNTGANRSGWSFTVKNSAGALIGTYTTGADGTVTVSDLDPGKYTVQEVGKSDAYWECDVTAHTVTVAAGSTANLTVTNTHYGRLKITKTTNTIGNKAGWQFEVYNSSGSLVGTYTTGEDGTVTTGNLLPGKYTVKEKASSNTYWNCDVASKTVTVVAGSTANLSVRNNYCGRIRIIKQTNTGVNRSGWEFEIYNAAGDLIDTITTGEDGTVTSGNLLPGTYTIKEKAENGSYWSCDIAEQDVTISVGRTIDISFSNTHHGRIQIVKTTNTGANIDGWEFEIYDAAGDLVGTYTTGTDGTVTTDNLLPGTYTIKEKGVDDRYWECDVTRKSVTVVAGSTASVTVNNNHYGEIQVTKNAINGSAEGWHFEIYDEENNLVDTITTNANGVAAAQDLLPGNYTVKEIHDRDAFYWIYDAEQEKLVTVAAGSQATVTYTNTEYGRLTVTKAIQTDGSMAEILEGWEFKVMDATGAEVEGSPFKTDASGSFTTGKLTPGTYTVEEVLPSGSQFQVVSENPATVTVAAGSTAELTITNAPISEKIVAEKINTDGDLLAGATFRLEWYDESAQEWKPIVYSDAQYPVLGGCSNSALTNGCLTTDTTGQVEFTNLYPEARYRLIEVKAPLGYVITEGEQEVDLDAEKTVFVNELIHGTISGKKVDEDGNTISGATFGLFAADETIFTTESALFTSTSDEAGVFGWENIPHGAYLVRELAPAPGFILNEQTYSVTVADDEEIIEVTVENKFITGSVTTTKVDAEYPNNKLAGAIFVVYEDTDGNEEFDAETDLLVGELDEVETGVYQLTDLRYGGYFLHEAAAPEYFRQDPGYYHFEIRTNGETVTVENKAGTGFINEPMEGSLELTKTDIFTGKPLADAKYRICDAAGNVVAEGVTNKDGIVTFPELRIGKYTYQESAAPDGYLLDTTKYSFEIKEDGEIVKAAATNTPIPETPGTGDLGANTLTISLIVFVVSVLALGVLLLLRWKLLPKR